MFDAIPVSIYIVVHMWMRVYVYIIRPGPTLWIYLSNIGVGLPKPAGL